MNVTKMYKYAVEKTEDGTEFHPIEGDRYPPGAWRRFAAMGFGHFIPLGDNELGFVLEPEALAWQILRRRDWVNRIAAYVLGALSTIAVELLISAIKQRLGFL